MPQSIKLYKIEKYPNEFPVHSAEVNPGYTQNTFRTTVKYLGKSEYTRIDLEKVQIIHEIADKFEGKGILEDGSIHELVAISKEEQFPCFIKNREFLYTSGKRIISEQALKRLRRHNKPDNHLIAKSVKIDLVAFKEYLEQSREGDIKGGWFRGMQIENVQVAYLGGGSVTESDDWERYETSGGTISALRIDIPVTGEEEDAIKTLLTRDGNLVIYKNYGENEMLRIAMPIFEAAEQFIEQ
ncbi:hypothetical protein [Geobacillus sp. JS12]|uniref:hypothetical protein n=1 Tax=Geobacillus sp. JS12 TaxID=1813182 RepID=UPI00078C21AB|nr:hypothetical protein [Geobacillus sp. JS12]AMQ19672.1 hypothetical protein A0V43_00265 [Geobacillus sp. JS12]